ncbi:hypothetical protein J3Q64DRAFT_1699021 [Phycomyces blakesleeanus]|uniref:Uncharacterized protein n=2 Tax=Phycomyces blakesleeanus TaxID=4837 RepID=A0A162U8S7_PHYB8|nr:hypothetical protein PHYBLDRAFT_168647 [Phycomyces blakesleeanus NRRL 1555(-)]OAD73293.1 hypothetical protein PHYBLDRAFT_168647 [Phycomyces blakesleeanus NRRL 1555(-)]|eukprot:XP_018291333.1 hypothetical protein PHYBLDRAFT_168647 [Phycomyces blakesleeanus NRRL 1555(-)]
MSPRITRNAPETNGRTLRFRISTPSVLNPKKHKVYKKYGFWSTTKELVLLKEYARIFPPLCKKGQHIRAWEKVAESVNAVTPNETKLAQDSCRRKVTDLLNLYKDNYRLPATSAISDPISYKAELDKAVYIIQQKRKLYERKKAHRGKLDFDIEGRMLEIDDLIKEMETAPPNRLKELQEDLQRLCQSDANQRVGVGRPENYSHASSVVQSNAQADRGAEDVNDRNARLDFMDSQKKFQEKVLELMKTQTGFLSHIDKLLWECLEELKKK